MPNGAITANTFRRGYTPPAPTQIPILTQAPHPVPIGTPHGPGPMAIPQRQFSERVPLSNRHGAANRKRAPVPKLSRARCFHWAAVQLKARGALHKARKMPHRRMGNGKPNGQMAAWDIAPGLMGRFEALLRQLPTGNFQCVTRTPAPAQPIALGHFRWWTHPGANHSSLDPHEAAAFGPGSFRIRTPNSRAKD